MVEPAWIAFRMGSSSSRKPLCRKDNCHEAPQNEKIPLSGITVALSLNRSAAPDGGIGHRAPRCAAPLLEINMMFRPPKPVLFFAGLMALVAFGSKANADFFSSVSETGNCVGETSSDSWIPYLAEYPEISDHLRCCLKLRVGVRAGAFSSDVDSASSVGVGQGGSVPGVPENKIQLYGFNQLLLLLQTTNTSGTTSSPSSPEQTSNPQAGVPAAHQEMLSRQVVTWLLAENQVLPGTPIGAGLFRPPRASA
jgi:hypothetical protein